jgi:hypothetical protein
MSPWISPTKSKKKKILIERPRALLPKTWSSLLGRQLPTPPAPVSFYLLRVGGFSSYLLFEVDKI